ncbi:MAG TPA: LamG-like jellyroll fold domain-containing protein [Puia sp.]|nr:LamG-like jellyroll fold domain-containing protein [Puia sp.]
MRRKLPSLIYSLLLLTASASAQNTALSFNGTDNLITTGAFVVPTSGDFTVEFWANVPTLLNSPSTLHEFVSQGTSGNGFYIGYDQSSGNLRCGDLYQGTNVACPVGKWFHVALVNSGGTATLYLDGEQRGTPQTGYSISTTGSNFTIGQQFAPFNELINGSMDEIRVWSVARTAAEIRSGMFGPVSVSATGLVAYYNCNEGTGSTVGNSTATTGQDGTYQGTVPATWASSPIQSGNNAISFDGTKSSNQDHIFGPGNAAYDFTTGTAEAWINPTTLSATNMGIVGLRTDGSTATRFSVHVSSTTIGMYNGSDFQTIPASIPTGTWTHLAFVFNASSTDVYQGTTSGTNTLIGTIPLGVGTATLTNLTIGYSKNNNPPFDNEFFDGAIDEVRLWNTVRTPTEISDNMLGTLSGGEAGLVAQYAFDTGVPSGDNTGLLTGYDNTANGNDLALQNFTMSGSASNFVVSPLSVILPVVFTSFTAVARDGQAYLQWQTGQEENSKEFIVQRSTDGINYSDIGSVAAAGTSHTQRTYNYTDATPATGVNYYRIKERDLDSHITYSSIRTLHFSATSPTRVAWSSLASGQAEITLLSGSNELYSVIDANGRKLREGRLSNGKLYLSGVAGGIYIVNITTQSGDRINTRILVK